MLEIGVERGAVMHQSLTLVFSRLKLFLLFCFFSKGEASGTTPFPLHPRPRVVRVRVRAAQPRYARGEAAARCCGR